MFEFLQAQGPHLSVFSYITTLQMAFAATSVIAAVPFALNERGNSMVVGDERMVNVKAVWDEMKYF